MVYVDIGGVYEIEEVNTSLVFSVVTTVSILFWLETLDFPGFLMGRGIFYGFLF